MPTFETAIRLVVIGQELLIAAVFLFSGGARVARISGALFMLSVAAYLYTSDAALADSIPLLAPVAMLFALIVPFCLWLFARAIFEAPWPKPVVVYACALLIVVVWGIYVAEDVLDPVWVRTAGFVIQVLKLIVVAHALWMTLRGRPDDLIERRRAMRLFFVGIISLQIAAVLIVELAMGGTLPPGWLQLANVIIIAILTLGLAMPMLRLNHEFFELQPGRESTDAERGTAILGAAESVLRDKLLALMDDGYYRETGLAIPVLAGKLGYPEHQVRRLINGYLGYRNFSAFLNSYRITAAKQQLTDPERARIPVLTIALNLGYASLGPFNRAFKEATGMTPTEFRRQRPGKTSADSE
jgi:AraC-like DNA-binding protein